MATTVVKTIGTGGDYSTLQSWEDACPANLVTADQIWQGKVKNQVFSGTSTLLTISGTTVDSTRYVELTTDTGASFADNASVRTNALRYNEANGASIKVTAPWATAISITQSFTRLSKLQIYSSSTNGIALSIYSPSNSCDINQCIVDSSIPGGLIIESNGAAHHLRNSLIVQRSSSTSAYIINGLGDKNITNCTLVATNGATIDTGIRNSYSTVNLKNVYIGGAMTNLTGGSSTFNKTTCFTNFSGPPSGWSAAAFSTATFESVTEASMDFRLKAGSGLIDQGTNDATYAAYDISGMARSGTYDVGAWEVAAGGGTNYTLTLDTGSYSITGENLVLGNTSSYVLSLDAGSYNIQSFPPVINIALGLDAENYILNGNDLTLSVTSVSGNTYSLVLEDGIYVGIGQDIGTILSYNIQLDQGTYSLDGKQVRLVSSTEPVILVNGNHTISISLKIGI